TFFYGTWGRAPNQGRGRREGCTSKRSAAKGLSPCRRADRTPRRGWTGEGLTRRQGLTGRFVAGERSCSRAQKTGSYRITILPATTTSWSQSVSGKVGGAKQKLPTPAPPALASTVK